MRKSGKSKPCPSVPLLHQGYRNNLYSLTVQLIIHKEPNAIKDLSEKGVKGTNLNLNTLTLFMTILLFKSISKEQIYLKKTTYNKIIAYSHLPKANCASYHHISLILLYSFFHPSSQIISTSVDRS